MDTWATVWVALIVALSTLGATFIQSWHSDKRFRVELGRAIDVDARKRKWEVRSELLLKLRNESARMAAKLDKLVAAAYRQLNRIGGTEEEARRELQLAIDDWNTYLAGGDFAQTLFMQYDAELRNKIEDIRKDYQKSAFVVIYYFQISKDAAKLLEAVKVLEKNKARVTEVQELINKRLEEL